MSHFTLFSILRVLVTYVTRWMECKATANVTSTAATETSIDVGGVRRGEEDAEIGAEHLLWRTTVACLQLSRGDGNGGGCLVANG